MSMTLLPLRTAASRCLLALWAIGTLGVAAAQQPVAAAGPQAERGVNEWLMRMQEASRERSYIGTFVVSSSGGALSSARIWHAGHPTQQVEKVDVLTGVPRSTYRRNEEVLTFLPEDRLVRAEKREAMGLFPNLLRSSDTSIPEFYTARRTGSDRVAGFDADVVQLAPRDHLRFGYRVWSEKRSGLVIKLQTLDDQGRVLEQAAFSELQLDVPVRADKIARMMQPPPGWRVERTQAVKTDAASEGWALKAAVPGFKPMNCYKRPAAGGSLQWIFSDGLAAVSLFIEPYDRERHQQEGLMASGATQTLTRHMEHWWVTVVGEVPAQTLRAFAQGIERRR
ncbi:MucB/RseB C-terminal domain-containing protein [Ramlibacter tataouinensis]|uniref:MucB/RseB C-terminal domain-containing protein n=1 Tax=Ramlibacter tataouinensis TaxID=94132 RepID=UPI0022F3B5D3|nr:MucB/RseB C-terminal domain-containing protein [Ramlibacter tataouinensis]WBY00882.1 MucB/RseB C-terminal domain-containing protein [Ramlibacter tataouinensis]